MADDSTLRDAALLALTTLEGWSNYDQWVWPISAMEQVRRGTTEAIAALRMALSRFAPPTEGEVAELAAKLCGLAPQNSLGIIADSITRAADLLQQQQAQIQELEQQLETERMRVEGPLPPLPAHALPLPQGEVAELAAWMESQATAHEAAQTQWAKRFVRAAELLRQFASPPCLVLKPSPEAPADE